MYNIKEKKKKKERNWMPIIFFHGDMKCNACISFYLRCCVHTFQFQLGIMLVFTRICLAEIFLCRDHMKFVKCAYLKVRKLTGRWEILVSKLQIFELSCANSWPDVNKILLFSNFVINFNYWVSPNSV